jgi:hypothetical protein
MTPASYARHLLLPLLIFAALAARADAQPDKVVAALEKAGAVFGTDPKDPAVPVSFTMGANATDKDLAAVAGLKTIREVKLPAAVSQVTDKGVAALAALPDLETLHVDNTQLTDAGLAKLKGLKNLKKLTIANTKVTDKGLAALKDFPALEWVGVGKLNVTATGLTSLTACKEVRSLFVADQPALTDAVLEKVAGMPKLERLEIARAEKVTDKGLVALKKASLQRLVIVNCKGVTDVGIAELKNYAQLTDLELWECKGVTDKSVPVLGGMEGLKSLKLSRSGVSKMGVEELKKLLPKTAITND